MILGVGAEMPSTLITNQYRQSHNNMKFNAKLIICPVRNANKTKKMYFMAGAKNLTNILVSVYIYPVTYATYVHEFVLNVRRRRTLGCVC